MKRMLALILAVTMVLFWIPVGASAAAEVTLSSGGSLNAALAAVDNGGTIRVSGTVSVSETLTAHNKTVTITGGELSFTKTTVTLMDNITFDNMTLTFPSEAKVYAAGYKVTIGEGVTLTNVISIFGGKSGGTVASTDLTLLAGTYKSVYGGSSGGTVTGDTHLTVGGTVNSTIDETDHNGKNYVHGGSSSGGTIGGTAYTLFTGNAKAHHLYGGGYDGGTITGGTDITVAGGKMMHVSGGYRGGTYNGDVKMTITGGTMEQVFGGNNGGAMVGNVQLDIMGGTITRRVYGGCYNEVDMEGLFNFVWKSSNYVTGEIVLTLHSGANITFTYNDDDRAIYAHSRQKTLSSTEVTHLVYADSTVYNAYKNKVKAQDTVMKLVMGSTSAADYIHYRTYTASGATITQSCICGGCAATATVSATNATYTGKAQETAKVTCTGTWYGGEPVLSYSNNTNAGTATASITAKGVTASTTFTISKADQSAPTLGKTDETVKGKADGKITGLTTAMEYSTDGATYTPVTDVNMPLAAGTYYVRYAAKTNYNASPATAVTVGAGRMLQVTFKAEGSADVVKEVAWNGTLTDIPAIPEKTGHTQTAPVWNVADFSGIQQDMTVNAVYTPDRYTVVFKNEDGTQLSSVVYNYGDTVKEPDTPAKAADETYTYTFAGWDKPVDTVCTADATYIATYSSSYIDYTVVFKNEDGTVLSTATYHYGDTVTAPEDPTKAADETYTYIFAGWDKAVADCAGDAVYTATYTAQYIEYTVVFKNADGTEISTATYHYGDFVVVPAEPAAPEGTDPTFVFDGWSPAVTACTGDAVYTAVFDAPGLFGDVTGDSVVDSKDVQLLLWHVLFPDLYSIEGRGDLDGDGYITNDDVLCLLWHSVFGTE